jgi:carboxypeptidase family protein
MLIPLLLASALLGPQATGSLAGCVKDAQGQVVPGASIAATGETVRHTTETNALGCYTIKSMAPGMYRVTARLTGFINTTRDKVNVAANAPTSLDLTLNVSPVCECVEIAGPLENVFKQADAVLHLRILGPMGGQSVVPTSYQHSAAVVHVLKGPDPDVRRIPLLQNQKSGAPIPFDVDDEMIVFVRSTNNGFAIINDDPGLSAGKKAMLFRVKDGQVVEAPSEFAKYVGMSLDAFIYELRGR